jgi:glycosyltransferase involved in cell wall biosynthesis
MARILFTSPVLEHPAAGGSQLRVENSIKSLAKLSELHVVSRVAAGLIGQPEDVAYLRGLCADFHFVPSVSGIYASHSYLARVYRKFFSHPRGALLEKDVRFFCDYAKKINADILWFGYGCISFPLIQRLRNLLPKVKFVCDTDSVWSRFVLRELDVEQDPARRRTIQAEGRAKEIEEKENAALCDVTTAVSEVDAQYYREITDDPAKVHLFSNVVDVDSYTEKPLPPVGYFPQALCLAGSYYSEYSPMVYAAKWTVNEVMPLVWEKYPEARLYLVGRGCDTFCAELVNDRVIATGYVESVLPYLCNAVCSLVPLFFESGTRFKILEAGACGIPVVSTTLGAEGIPVTHGKDCLIADEPEDFAAAICRLLKFPELGRAVGEACKSLVRRHYSIDSLAEEAEAIIRYLHVVPGKTHA